MLSDLSAKRRASLLVAALGCALLPSVAGAAVAPDGALAAVGSNPYPGPNDGPATKYERTSARAAGLGAGAYAEPYSGIYNGPDQHFGFFPARVVSADGTADFDGDGVGDVIACESLGDDARVAVRRGTDGQLIWSHRVSASEKFIAVGALRVGAPARPGVVVVSLTYGAWQAGSRPITVHVRAYDPHLNQLLWTRHLGGGSTSLDVFGDGYRWNDTPFVTGWLPAGPGQASGLLFSRSDGGVGFAGLFHLYSSAIIVNGADGRAREIAGDATYWPAGDLDRDGLADLVVYGFDSDADAYLLDARSSADGRLLWRRAGAVTLEGPTKDTGGDGIPDVLGREDSNPNTIEPDAWHLINGHSGQTRISRPFDERRAETNPPYSSTVEGFGDVTGDGADDLLFLRPIDQYSGADHTCGWRFSAYSGRTAALIWQRNIVVTSPGPNNYCVADRPQLVGDVDADAVQDYAFEIKGYATDRNVLVSGRAGQVREGGPLPTPLFAAVNGTGHDFAALEVGTTSITVKAIDGLTRAALWTFSQSTAQNWTDPAGLYAAQLTSDNRADVVAAAGTNGRGYLGMVVDGATGTQRWSVSISPSG